MLSLLERSRYSVFCRGVSSVICRTTSLDKLALCVCVYVYIYIFKNPTNNPPNQLQNKNKKKICLHLPSRFFWEMSITFTLLTWPRSSFQTTLLKSVLLLSPFSCFCSCCRDSCFLASFPLLCFLPFLSCLFHFCLFWNTQKRNFRKL